MDIVTYALLNGKIKDYASNVDEWLEENVDPDTGYVLDRSLQMENAAAPADMVGDINVEVGDLKNTLNHKADLIYDTASGDIVSFPDGADGLPVKDLTVSIEPVQSGTGDPSPTNVRPISGWTGANVIRTGKNLFDPSVYETLYLTDTQEHPRLGHSFESGTYSITNTSNATWYYRIPKRDLSDRGTSVMIGAGSSATVTADSTHLLWVFTSGQWAESYPNLLCVSAGTNTAYEPYSGTTIPISWQSEAGTVYGGTLDVTSGVLTVTDANIASYNGETLPGEWISDRDVYFAGATPTTGAQVVYKLTTPQTYQRTPQEAITTLLGQNNIWADCGPSTVEYPADTKLYIQKINAPTDDDMIADANIASGKYFIVNNNLYLSTAAILTGDPIKPGTNCTLTNLAAALNALNS